ncbi:MAG TPA: ATP-binding protein [Steroidobacteraceae bacterium]|jgi:signal transduction histidine kinase|nr:ATP-binding protein [Steroidobacteraceae bacterium]
MLSYLRRRLNALWPDPANTSLGWWMVAVHVLLVLLVGVGLSATAIGMLRVLADEQGKSRVLLAGATAREDVRRMTEDALNSARVLAQRPTLQRLLDERQDEAIAPFLRRFCDTSQLDACAIFSATTLLAATGPALDWQGIKSESAEQGPTFLALPANVRLAAFGAFVSMPGTGDVRIYVLRLMDARLAHELTERVGTQVHFIDYRSYTADAVNAYTPLYSAALADGHSAVRRIDPLGLYEASVPLFASSGEAIGFIDAGVPIRLVESSTTRLIRDLVLTTLILAAFAVLAGAILSQRVVGPVKALTDSAVHIGRGDFSVSIPPGGAAEVGALARTMEDMRRNLLELTGTLRRREAEAQAVLTGIVEGVYAVDEQRNVRYLNTQAARLLRIQPQEAVGRFCGDVLQPLMEDGRRPCDERCPIVKARSEGNAQCVERLQRGKETRTVVVTSSGLVDGLQVQVIRDETELEAVRRARDSVLANISHEFRTPLAAQLASIELLLDNLETMAPAQRRELTESLQRGTLRLTRLIDNLLESVRIESGQLAIRRQSVDLAEVIEDARSLIGSLLALKRQRLEVSLPEELPLIEGDKHRLTQVFVNLLANANKFAPEGSAVRIGCKSDEGHLAAWVEDEGPGPASPAGEGLFAPFHRGSDPEPEPGGLGLGLWIVRSIVERHGGTIAVARTEESRTRFTMTLPLEVTA